MEKRKKGNIGFILLSLLGAMIICGMYVHRFAEIYRELGHFGTFESEPLAEVLVRYNDTGDEKMLAVYGVSRTVSREGEFKNEATFVGEIQGAKADFVIRGDVLKKALEKVDEVQEHQIIRKKIFETDQYYYIATDLNVNWHDPVDLYRYDKKNRKIMRIGAFENVEILGIRDNEITYYQK